MWADANNLAAWLSLFACYHSTPNAAADSDLDLALDPPRLRRKAKFKDEHGHGKVPAEAILVDSIKFGQETATIQDPEPAHVAVMVPADLR